MLESNRSGSARLKAGEVEGRGQCVQPPVLPVIRKELRDYGKETQTQKHKEKVGHSRRSRLGEKACVDAPDAGCSQGQSFETKC